MRDTTLADLQLRDASALARTLSMDMSEARGEVRVLLSHTLAKPKAWLLAHERDPVQAIAPDLTRYSQALERRLRGEPVAYILGVREFYGLEFEVTPSVLIPRPETELLVDTALRLLSTGQSSRVLDLGTGSGCIAIAIASELAHATVVATDQSTEALQVARRNRDRLGLDNVELLHSSWFGALPPQYFDLIVSNPPYINADDPHLRQGDLRFEPPNALTPGASGMAALRQIAQEAPSYLRSGGWLVMEHGYDQGRLLHEHLQTLNYEAIEAIHDLAGNWRATLGRRPALGSEATTFSMP